MQDINTTTITGRVATDVELKQTPNGTHYTEFRVTVNDRIKGEDGSYADRPNFVPVKVWKGQADACAASLVKGQAVTVAGRLRQESWGTEDERRSRLYVVAEHVIFGAKPRNTTHPEPVEATATASA